MWPLANQLIAGELAVLSETFPEVDILKSILSLITRQNKILKESIWSVLAKAVAGVFSFVTFLCLARFLGPSEYGTLSIFISVLLIAKMVLDGGISQGNSLLVAKANQENPGGIRPVLLKSLQLRMIVNILFVLLCVALFPFLKRMLVVVRLEHLTVYLIVAVVLGVSVDFFKYNAQGMHRLFFSFVFNLIEYGLFMFAACWLAFNHQSVRVLLGGYCMSYCVTLVIISLITFCFLNLREGERADVTPSFSAVWKSSYPFILLYASAYLFAEADTYMLGVLAGSEEAGYYSVAKQYKYIAVFAVSVGMGIGPAFINFKKDRCNLSRVFWRSICYCALFYVTFAFIIFFLNKWFVITFYGKQFLPAAPILKVISLFVIMFSLSAVIGNALDYMGYARQRALLYMISFIINILLNLVLIPRFNGLGAAISSLISFTPFFVGTFLMAIFKLRSN